MESFDELGRGLLAPTASKSLGEANHAPALSRETLAEPARGPIGEQGLERLLKVPMLNHCWFIDHIVRDRPRVWVDVLVFCCSGPAPFHLSHSLIREHVTISLHGE